MCFNWNKYIRWACPTALTVITPTPLFLLLRGGRVHVFAVSPQEVYNVSWDVQWNMGQLTVYLALDMLLYIHICK